MSIIFFTEILLVGSGTIACDCLNEIVNYVDASNIHVIEIVESSLSFLKKQCKKNNVEYFLSVCAIHRYIYICLHFQNITFGKN